jgi:formimidoylglutamate deiminase
MSVLYLPDLLYMDGGFVRNAGLLVGADGRIVEARAGREAAGDEVVKLPGKVLLSGFANAHSHAFQRLIRGKSESRATSGRDFWSWRGTMYHAAAQMSPEDVYDVARMAFLEMALAGTTTVGEFHYLHNAQDGKPYDDANLLSKQVIAAARSVGIRIVLLRSAYFRSGYKLPRDGGQTRFFETLPEFLKNMDALVKAYPVESNEVQLGVAPHSIRAVPLADLKEITGFARDRKLPVHMHVAEQVAENEACVREYGLTPVALLGREKLLGRDFTAVHATHVTPDEVRMMADAGMTICACPTTERNLGDGIFEADRVMRAGIRVALGSDSQAQIDPLEDARELDYHLRLRDQQRTLLDQIDGQPLAKWLWECATIGGAQALGVSTGRVAKGEFADFFTVDLNDASIAGSSAENLLPLIVFSLERTAIRDVAVNGRLVVRDGRHERQDEIVSRYKGLHEKVWSGAKR